MGGRWIALEQLLHVLMKHAVVGQPWSEVVELLAIRQLAVDQQVTDFAEAAFWAICSIG